MALTYPGAIMKTYPVGDRTLQTIGSQHEETSS